MYKYNKIDVTEENIDSLIDKWHDSSTELSLHEYLGITWENYRHWAETGILLKEEKSQIEKAMDRLNVYDSSGKSAQEAL